MFLSLQASRSIWSKPVDMVAMHFRFGSFSKVSLLNSKWMNRALETKISASFAWSRLSGLKDSEKIFTEWPCSFSSRIFFCQGSIWKHAMIMVLGEGVGF